GQQLQFTVHATDVHPNYTVKYSAVDLPPGAKLDATTGTFTWTSVPGQNGDYPVTFIASDGTASSTQTVLVRAQVQPTLPQVLIVQTPSSPAVPGQAVQIQVTASSLADITGVTLSVAGQPVTLDAQGRATVIAPAPGRVAL